MKLNDRSLVLFSETKSLSEFESEAPTPLENHLFGFNFLEGGVLKQSPDLLSAGTNEMQLPAESLLIKFISAAYLDSATCTVLCSDSSLLCSSLSLFLWPASQIEGDGCGEGFVFLACTCVSSGARWQISSSYLCQLIVQRSHRGWEYLVAAPPPLAWESAAHYTPTTKTMASSLQRSCPRLWSHCFSQLTRIRCDLFSCDLYEVIFLRRARMRACAAGVTVVGC